MTFIDIHTHIIPFIDDGAENWSVALEMLRQGVRDGIGEIVCTPHILSNQDFRREEEIFLRYEELKHKANSENIPIEIHLGAELYIQPDLALDRDVATLAQNGRYFLVEFSMTMIPDFVAKKFFELIIEEKTPIIAHPERNVSILTNPLKAYDFVEKGALLQINSGSLLGQFGQKVKTLAYQLIDANLVHVISSDAHNADSRPLQLREAWKLVCERWDEATARKLFHDNPKAIIQGTVFDKGVAKPITSPKKLTIREKFNSLVEKLK